MEVGMISYKLIQKCFYFILVFVILIFVFKVLGKKNYIINKKKIWKKKCLMLLVLFDLCILLFLKI